MLNFRRLAILIIVFHLSLTVFAQNGVIRGVVKDKKTGETIVGANVVIDGTSIGKSSDIDGKFEISGLKSGTYKVNVSYISYKAQSIDNVKVENGKSVELNISLEEDIATISGVTIKDRRKTDTDISIISSIKNSDLVVSGISSQMISKSQDKDAAEVVRRIPGITIIGNRFIVVRGLNERYNTVWLNYSATPSLETDVKAFSFDMIPSSMIDNIMVFKTPAPELPADFAGAAIEIFTKDVPDQNSISVSYGAAFLEGTSFKTFYTYQGGKYDALGFDDGTRALPKDFPTYHLNEIPRTPEGKIYRTEVGRMLNKIWEPEKSKAINDNKASLSFAKKFLIGKSAISNITAINYSNTYSTREVYRANYLAFDKINDESDTAYYFNDVVYSSTSKVSALCNWSFSRGGHSVELRNLLNQTGSSKTTMSDGRDNYGGMTLKSYELDYNQRTIYSGQLGGKHKFYKDLSKINWTLGYSYAYKNQPDIRRVTSVLNDDIESPYYGMYGVNFNFAANSDQNGRIYMSTKENILTAALNYEQKINIGNFMPEIKAGAYYENKSRDFDARLLGFAIAKSSSFNWDLPYMPIDSIFADTNINATTGVRIDEQTNSLDTYDAQNELIAAYIGFKIPFLVRFSLYAGVRMEKYKFRLNSGDEYTPINVASDTINFFPSANLSFNITEKSLLRFAYGQTVNRPEFREVSPFNFFIYDMKAFYKGNPSLKSAYIQNFDLRYEFYPSLYEMITVGAFYKSFKNPIEAAMYAAGSGWDYTYVNAIKSYSYGAEVDVRKSFRNLGKKTNALRYFKDFTVVLNASVIKSQVTTDDVFARDRKRPMQGQSPYIVNAGLYWENDSIKLGIALLYNVVGRRIIFVGNITDPHTYEMPRNVLDLSISKGFGKYFIIKFGISDILNQKVRFVQFEEFEKDIDGDGKNEIQIREQNTRIYKPGRLYSLTLSLKF